METKEAKKMGAAGKLVLFGAGVLSGLGGGYFFLGANEKRCEEFYNKQVAQIVSKYENLPTTPGVAGPNDLKMEYLVSESTPFSGLIFTDRASGAQGVVTKNQIFGKSNYDLEYADISKLLETQTGKAALPLAVRVYSAKQPQN